VVYHPAHSYHSGIHSHLRQYRQTAHRRAAGFPFLSFRQHRVDILFNLPCQHLQHLRGQCGYFWQGLFPPYGHPAFHRDLQPDLLRHPPGCLPGIFTVFYGQRFSNSSHPVGAGAACVVADHGWHGVGAGCDHLVINYQIPRPAAAGGFWSAAFDVCHASHLPTFHGAGCLALGDPGQPYDRGGGSFPARVSGHQFSRPIIATVQCRVHPGGDAYRAAHF